VNCICGCGTRLGLKGVELNLLAGEVAIELVVWDKARALRSPVAAAEIEAILVDGAPHYQRLLGRIHAGSELGEGEREGVGAWLERSRLARLRLGGQLPVVPKKKVSLSAADQERIDRVHPERTFSGLADQELPPEPARPANPKVAADPELDVLIAAADSEDYERLAVAWLGRLVVERPPSLDELRWLLGRLEDVRSGRVEEAEPALRRFLSERS
jgi:hypothetical protein